MNLLEFNWHPLLMVIGLVYLYGNGILTYRLFRTGKKKFLKVVHAAIMLAAFVFSVIALQAAFDSHNLKGVAFYTFICSRSFFQPRSGMVCLCLRELIGVIFGPTPLWNLSNFSEENYGSRPKS